MGILILHISTFSCHLWQWPIIKISSLQCQSFWNYTKLRKRIKYRHGNLQTGYKWLDIVTTPKWLIFRMIDLIQWSTSIILNTVNIGSSGIKYRISLNSYCKVEALTLQNEHEYGILNFPDFERLDFLPAAPWKLLPTYFWFDFSITSKISPVSDLMSLATT